VGLELRLAWRNVWRNPRRTALTVAATVFAVFLVVIFLALGHGIHEKMIEDSVRVASGHVTISGEGYLENRTLEHYVELSPELAARLDAEAGVVGWAPRVVSFVLVSRTESSQGAVVLGVDPEREPRVSTLAERVGRGRFLRPGGAHEVVLGEALARQLGAEPGDELLLFGTAYSLETAYELFTLVGTVRLPQPDLERSLALIRLDEAQDFFVYGDRVSEIAVLAESNAAGEALRDRLRATLGEIAPVEVHDWREVMPELEQLIILDDAGMYILLVILVVVVGFGILNTILMAVLERTQELGVILAVGLRPGAVFRIVFLESLLLAGVGLALGLLLAIPTSLYLGAHPVPLTGPLEGASELFGMEPVLTWRLKLSHPLNAGATILGVAILAALYPALKASRARPVEALRSV
jgi:putative ABC transport system permease protein